MSRIQVPAVTFEDLQAFQAKHFPGSVLSLQPDYQTNTNTVEVIDHDDDGLGYYPNGVKRTLTDEQIRIFRHSEVHAIFRERQLMEENGSEELSPSPESKNPEEGAQLDPKSTRLDQDASKTKLETNAVEQAEEEGTKEQTKATVSDTPLDYGEESVSKPGTPKHSIPSFMGRRIISYDD